MKRLGSAFLMAAVFATGRMVIAQPSQPANFQAALTTALRQLSACQTQLGPLIGLQAEIVAGTYTDWATVKAEIEKANPTLVLDLKTRALAPKPVVTEK